VQKWLKANNFMVKKEKTVRPMSDDWINTISKRYIELYEKVIGQPFRPEPLSDDEIYSRIMASLNKYTQVTAL